MWCVELSQMDELILLFEFLDILIKKTLYNFYIIIIINIIITIYIFDIKSVTSILRKMQIIRRTRDPRILVYVDCL